jgi:hypothetical protein
MDSKMIRLQGEEYSHPVNRKCHQGIYVMGLLRSGSVFCVSVLKCLVFAALHTTNSSGLYGHNKNNTSNSEGY